MINVNKVVLVGRLTADVEVRKTQSNLSVASFTVAVNDGKEKAYFINCVVWRHGADFLGQYAHKGDTIAVEGKITTRSYERDDQKVYVTEVVADTVQIEAHKAQSSKNEEKPMPKQNESQAAQNWGYGIDIGPDDLPF